MGVVLGCSTCDSVVVSLITSCRIIEWLVLGWGLQAGIPHWYVSSYPGQLRLLPSVGPEMSTGKVR